MFNILRTLVGKRATTSYPAQPEAAPPAYRGRPALNPAACDCTGECAAVCPSGAITVGGNTSGAREWRLDLARCVFCGLCEEACPKGAVTLTNDFELAARRRADLIDRVALPGKAEPDAPAAPAPEPAFAAAEELSGRIRARLRRSLHIRHMDAGSENSCDWEMSALLGPVYDVQRLGIDFVASPRHADLLMVTGAVTRHLAMALRRTYEAMPAPRLVVAVGDEACSGGILQGSYAVLGGVDRCLPVDVYIPGDPPRPQALIQGLLIAMGRLESKRGGR